MPKYHDPKYVVSSYFNHLGMLENNSAALYDALAKKVKVPSVQSLLQKIASDGQKHTLLLKGLSEKMMIPHVKSIENETEFGDAFKIIFVVHQDIDRKEMLGAVDLLAVSAKLALLENLIDKKYSISRGRILRAMERAAGEFQSISLDSFNSFFDRIALDEAQHQKLLAGVEGLIGVPEQVAKAEAEVRVEVNPLPLELPHEALLLEGYTRKA